MSSGVVVSVEAPIARVTLDRPQQRNALSLALMRELIDVLHDVGARLEVQVVVLAGNGPAFSAGHDLREMTDTCEGPFFKELFDTCVELMETIHALDQPVIARVHGVATAAGCQLVAACDLVVASDDARFATPGVNIGLFCSTPMVPITRAVGRKRAMEMLLTGELIDAPTAAAWGLVNRVVPAAALDAEVDTLAARIAAASRAVVALGKHAFYEQIDATEHDAYAITAPVMTANAQLADAQEGMRAFLDKRPPRWPSPQLGATVARLESLGPLRNRAYRAVWTGSFVSNIGTWMQAAALGFYVADLTKSAAWSAVTAAAEFAPAALLSPIGGALADRMSRRALFLAGTIAQMLLAAALTVAMVATHPGAPAVALYALGNGCVFALVSPAFFAIVPDLVPLEELAAAVGLNSAQWNLGRVVGPVLGAGIYQAFGISWVLGFNAVSFLAVVIALSRVHIPRPTVTPGPILAAIVDGWRFVRREPGLRLVVGAMTLNTICIAPFIGLIPAMVVKVFHAGKGSVGLLITAQGLGAVVTGFAFGNATRRFGVRRVMLAALVGLPITVSAYALSPNVGVAAVGLFFTGMLYFAAMSSFSTIAQLRAPSEYRGRVLSANQVVLGVGYVAGLNLQGPLGDRVGVRAVTVAAGAISLGVLGAIWLTRRGITRALDDEPDAAVLPALAGGR